MLHQFFYSCYLTCESLLFQAIHPHGLHRTNVVTEGLNPALSMDVYYGTNHLIHRQSLNLEVV
jgi:hypothetical protein